MTIGARPRSHGQPTHRHGCRCRLARHRRDGPASRAPHRAAGRVRRPLGVIALRRMHGRRLAWHVAETARRDEVLDEAPGATTCGTAGPAPTRRRVVVERVEPLPGLAGGILERRLRARARAARPVTAIRMSRGSSADTWKRRVAMRRASASPAGTARHCSNARREDSSSAVGVACSRVAPAAARSPARYWSTAVCQACSGAAAGCPLAAPTGQNTSRISNCGHPARPVGARSSRRRAAPVDTHIRARLVSPQGAR